MNQPSPASASSCAPFETPDLMLASFLRCRSFRIEAIKRQNGRTLFVFDDSPHLR